MSVIDEVEPKTRPIAARPSLKERQFVEREEAILVETIALLRQRGYELMTLDQVAENVGIAKGSIYKHFASKEKLAAAVMTRLFRRSIVALASQAQGLTAIARLRALLHWTLEERLKGSVPHLPSTSMSLSTALMSDENYVGALMALNVEVLELIRAAQVAGDINPTLSDEFVMYSLYSRTCDPTLELLADDSKITHATIVDWMLTMTFDGLSGKPRGGYQG